MARLKGALLESLALYHGEHPLSLGAHRRELRRGRLAHLPDRVFDDLVDQLADGKAVVVEGPIVRASAFEVALTDDQQALRDKLLQNIVEAGLTGRSTRDLVAAFGDDHIAALLRLLEADEAVLDIASIGWVAPRVLSDLEGRVRGWFAEHDTLKPADFKELTGLTRKAAIPLLEWLDGKRITRRDGDARVAGAALG